MNNFFAMLKDSFREAIDGWIFYVMLGLIGLVVLLVLSIGVTPLPADQAVRHIAQEHTFQTLHPERGTSNKIFMIRARPVISDLVGGETGSTTPWNNRLQFTLDTVTEGFGLPGAIEVDDAKNPTKVKPVDGGGLFSNSFKSAVRLWAMDAEGKKPKYTDDLGIQFLEYQLRNAGELNVTDIVKLSEGKFRVTAEGVVGRKAWPHSASIFFGAWDGLLSGTTLGHMVYFIEDILLNTFGAWVLLLTGVVVTAGFIPNMMRKGAIDLLLTKPMSRPFILIAKYFGGLTFVFVLTLLAVGGVWLAVGIRTGIWSPGLLYCVLGITFYFAILYACSTLAGVLTRNAIVCIILTVLFWFVIWLIGYLHSTFTMLNSIQNIMPNEAKTAKVDGDEAPEKAEKIPAGLLKTFEILNRVTPRTKDLDKLTTRLISADLLSPQEQQQGIISMSNVRWGEVLAVASAWLALLLGLAMLRFMTRSY